MKVKFVATLLALALLLSCVSVCFAADAFTFRGIPWFTTKVETLDAMASAGYKAWWNSKDTTIPDWFQTWSNIIGDYKVANGGCECSYKNVAVAGYSAKVDTYFIYPIVNGKVSRDNDKAQLYLARYIIEGFEDMEAVYADLKVKLSGLYGEPVTKNSDSSWTDTIGVKWTAEDGSSIWLARYTAYGDTDVKIWYIAPNCTEMLQTLEAQITQETIDAEEQARQDNKNNTSGL